MMVMVVKLNACHKILLLNAYSKPVLTVNHTGQRRQGLFFIIKTFHIHYINCQPAAAGVA
ncbi:hypothetical protein C5940_03875 [Cronobacter sakazakii]|nr:hypothetical protein C5940_03875 [Cronobacter sakazakii]RRA44191.1 hypothetical protein C3O73_15135 [Cronobacter sakazakii]